LQKEYFITTKRVSHNTAGFCNFMLRWLQYTEYIEIATYIIVYFYWPYTVTINNLHIFPPGQFTIYWTYTEFKIPVTISKLSYI